MKNTVEINEILNSGYFSSSNFYKIFENVFKRMKALLKPMRSLLLVIFLTK